MKKIQFLNLGLIATVGLGFSSIPAGAQVTVPPPNSKPTKTEEVAGGLGAANGAANVVVDVGLIAGSKLPESVKKLEKSSETLGKIGVGLQAVEMAGAVYRQDSEAVMDQSLGLMEDAIVSKGCDLATAGQPVASTACQLSYQGGKMIGQGISAGVKSWTGKEIGEIVYDAAEDAKHSMFPETDPSRDEYWAELRRQHAERVKASAQCHAGHNEAQHPGGCLEPRLP
jgi:hypothetical protein